jgi:hypothetical protein
MIAAVVTAWATGPCRSFLQGLQWLIPRECSSGGDRCVDFDRRENR